MAANLPYNIATPLIVHWLTAGRWPPWFDKLIVMVQREVAERLVAPPASEQYGRLAVLAQYRARPRILFTLPPTYSCRRRRWPPPSSRSFRWRKRRTQFPSPFLERVTAAAFGQRRKMLRSSLASLGADTAALLRDAGIDPEQRAERLTIADFVSLARELASQKGRA